MFLASKEAIDSLFLFLFLSKEGFQTITIYTDSGKGKSKVICLD